MRYFVKTDAGRTAIAKRSRELRLAERQLLIMCDGERSLDELRRVVPDDDLDATALELCRQGLLAPKAGAAPAALAPTAPAMDDVTRFQAASALATALAVDLGFAARFRMQLQIEKAANLADFAKVATDLERLLAGQSSSAAGVRKLRRLTAPD